MRTRDREEDREAMEEVTHSISCKEVRTPAFLRPVLLQVFLWEEGGDSVEHSHYAGRSEPRSTGSAAHQVVDSRGEGLFPASLIKVLWERKWVSHRKGRQMTYLVEGADWHTRVSGVPLPHEGGCQPVALAVHCSPFLLPAHLERGKDT